MLSKQRLDLIKKRYGENVVIPIIDGDVGFLYLREGEDGDALNGIGFDATGEFVEEGGVVGFMKRLEFRFVVGDLVKVRGFGRLQFKVLEVLGDRVRVLPCLRFHKGEMVFRKEDILKGEEGVSYLVQLGEVASFLGVDIDYLAKVCPRALEGGQEFFTFVLRLKLEFRGLGLVFFSERRDRLVGRFAEVFKFSYVVGRVPVASVYFTDRDYLRNGADYLVHFENNSLAFYESKVGCNEYLRYVVGDMIKEGRLGLVSSLAREQVERGDEEGVYRSFYRWKEEIGEKVRRLEQREVYFAKEEPVSMERFLRNVEKLKLSWVLDSPDYFYRVVYN